VGNEEKILDPNRTMINITNKFSDAHKKNPSKRKLWKRSLRNSWRNYKTQLTRKYKSHSRNIKTSQMKSIEKTQKQRTSTNSKVKQRRLLKKRGMK
jgi:hypothetical protein